MSITLTPHQQESYDKIKSQILDIIDGNAWNSNKHNIIDLQGFAGVGKTVIIAELIKDLKPKIKIKLTTPTHKSLKVANDMLKQSGVFIDSSTIHSHLNLKQKPSYNPKVDYVLEMDPKARLKNKVDLLIVDESSMVAEDLYEFVTENLDSGQTKVILFVGDPAQLESPSGTGNPIYNNKHITHYKLTEIVRQAENNPIIYIATKFREAIQQNKVIDIDAVIKEIPLFDTVELYDGDNGMKKWMQSYLESKEDKTIGAYTNQSVDSYNQFVRTFVYQSNTLDYVLDGEKVVIQSPVVNDKEVIYRNGEVITVKTPYKTEEDGMVIWNFNKMKTVDIASRGRYNQIKNSLKDSAIKDRKMWFLYYNFLEEYTDIKPLHACTYHKVQGSTYHSIWLNLKETKMYLSPKTRNTIYRLIYVGLTRASDTVHIIL